MRTAYSFAWKCTLPTSMTSRTSAEVNLGVEVYQLNSERSLPACFRSIPGMAILDGQRKF
jgi:hypothetical protein